MLFNALKSIILFTNTPSLSLTHTHTHAVILGTDTLLILHGIYMILCVTNSKWYFELYPYSTNSSTVNS